MISTDSLIQLFRKALDEKWGYIWGKAGSKWTQELQDAAERAYRQGNNQYEMASRYGQQWVGRRVADCSGLFYWAFKELGGYMYHGSNTMWQKYCTAKGTLQKGARTDGKELKPGTAVFKVRNNTDYYHVGLYVGDGKVIEAQGTRTGVVTSPVTKWHTWGELKGVSYDGSVSPMNYQDAMVTANGGVNMRSQTSTTSLRIAIIPKGAVIKAAVIDNDWSAVEYNGKTGYVKTEFITYTEQNNDDGGNVVFDGAFAIIENIEKELAQLKTLLGT